ncbi:Serine/threonine-protein phosphatase BSL1 [Sarcoptes scabiei]|uniref:Serine/threonine-protein phosphatase n=1 Tax=Sarcoptes scabiei TaxID=52283 RepID=A0A834R6W7_SARSC|nr:Serine/threonine-protein phosphatase BSL1 [Sarcoptes scabiei]
MFDLMWGSSFTNNIRSMLQIESQPKSAPNSLASRSNVSLFSRSRFNLRPRSKHSKKESNRSKIGSKRNSRQRRTLNINTNNNHLPFACGLDFFQANSALSTSRNRLYDCAVYYIHCVQHETVAVTVPSEKQAVWLPFMPIPTHRSWYEGGLAGLLIILSEGNIDKFVDLRNKPPFNEFTIIEVAAIQKPQTLEMINRITWLIKIDTTRSESNKFQCCQKNDSMVWVKEKDLEDGKLDYVWGPELIEIYRLHFAPRREENTWKQGQTNSNFSLDTFPQMIKSNCNFIEHDLQTAFQFMPKSPPKTDEEAMLLSCNLSEKDIERLYGDYLNHCFPAISMTFHSFKIYLAKYKFIEENNLMNLFNAFNYNSTGSITFPELLMGLACLDSHSAHNEVRTKFVMRFYDVEKRNYLTSREIYSMLKSIHPKETEEEIQTKLIETIKVFEPTNLNDPERITYRAFVEAVGGHKFRGTSKLCRSKRPVFRTISSIMFSRKKNRRGLKDLMLMEIVEGSYSGFCSNCKEKQPIIEETILKINKDGYVYGQQRIKNQPEDSKFSNKQSSLNATKEEVINVSLNLMKLIREFAPKKGDSKKPNGILATCNKDRKQFYEMLCIIEKYLSSKFESEQRCVTVHSPAFLIGDIHGNLDDLLTLEQNLWKRYPSIDGNLIFLGDYVDRGRWSIECIAYLFALKAIMSEKITMLRGNHEVRPLQAHYSYRMECLNKYGEDFGIKIWDLTNRLFDRLPFCAVIDEAIYCAHGGIPRCTKEIAEIQRLERLISEPDHGHPIAWEILWSDPVHQQQFLELACLINSPDDFVDGFLPNRKRGTAFVFNEEAATKFLKHNGLTHIIRAHEVPSSGFFFHFDKKCATIFSSSHYCGNNNECAIVLVEGDTIRIVRIDTTNNKSATD